MAVFFQPLKPRESLLILMRRPFMSEALGKNTDDLGALKKLATTVYLCQVLTFFLAGLPLLVGGAINFMNRNDAKGTWLESHFNWQIKTLWLTLAGFALSGLTFSMGIGLYILFPTLAILATRIAIGWTALMADKPISDDMI
jgi:uncharacterized membrane protein